MSDHEPPGDRAAGHPAPAADGQPQHPGPPEQDLREEMLALLEHTVERLQVAGTRRLRGQDRAEPRWPVSASVIVAIALQWALSSKLSLHPTFLLPALEIALLIGLHVVNPLRIERMSGPIRVASLALVLLITAANAASAGLLIRAIVTSHVHVPQAPITLLASGAAIWGTNVIAFALWYWEFDRGGPVHRLEGRRPYPDLLFPQMTSPDLAVPGWGPRFVDYLYLSFTNATAFSPTDVMPLARWAKLTMLVQSAVSLALGALVVARAVNIL